MASAEEILQQPLTLGSGRRNAQLAAKFSRELSAEDLVRASTQEMGTVTPFVQQLRQSHHMLARVLAQGAGTNEASEITGFSPSRISILKSDPAFRELFEYYKGMEKEQFAIARVDMHKRLAAVGFDSLEILHERLLDAPDAFDNKTLLAVVEATADRTGHGKTSTINHDHAHSLSSESIASLKAAVNEGRPLAEADRGALLRLAAGRTAEGDPEALEAEWVESGGSELREESHSEPEEAFPSGSGEVS